MAKVINTVLSLKDDFSSTLSKVQKNAEKASSRIGKAISGAESPTQKLSAGFKAVGAEVTRMGKAFMPVSLAVGGAMAACLKSASDFEQGMAKVSTLVDKSKVSMKDLSNQFLEVAKSTHMSATEIADAGYQALSAGVNAKSVASFVESAGKLAKAGFTDTTTAVDVLTTVINAYGMKAKDADAIANRLVRTQNMGKTTVDELASSMGKVIPIANATGTNLDNLATAYAKVTKEGTATAEAGTGIKAMLSELSKSSTGVAKILQAETGKSFKELSQEGKSTADILQILQESANRSGKELKDLFGSVEAGGVATTILNGGVDDFNSMLKEMGSNVDTVGQNLKDLSTPEAQFKNAIQDIKTNAVILGESIRDGLAPFMVKFASVLNRVSTAFSNLSPRTKSFIVIVGGIVAAIGPVLVIVGTMISAIGAIIPVIAAVGAAVVSASGVIFGAMAGIAAFLIANPIVLLITAIGVAIALLARYIYKHWDEIKAKFSAVISALKQGWADFKSNAVSAWNTVKSTVSGVINTIRSVVSTGFNTVKTIITTAVNTAKSTLTSGFNAMKTAASSVVNAIIDKFNSLKNKLTSIVDGIKSKISSVTSAVSSVGGFLTGHATGTSYFTGGLTRVNEHGGEIINLPSGAQIIPHDLSKKQLSGSGVTVNVTVQGNIIGNAEYADYLGGIITRRVISAMNNI